MAVGHLAVENVHGRGIGIKVRLIVFGVEPDQNIRDNERPEVIACSCEALTQVVTKLFETENIRFDLIAGNLFVNLEPRVPRKADRHGGEAVVMAGSAGGLGHEIGVGLLDYRQAGLNGACQRVPATRFEIRGHLCRGFRAGLYEEINDGSFAMKFLRYRERREPRVAAFVVAIDRIHISAVLNKKLHFVQRKEIGGSGVHQRGPSERVVELHVSAEVEHETDGLEIADLSDVGEC